MVSHPPRPSHRPHRRLLLGAIVAALLTPSAALRAGAEPAPPPAKLTLYAGKAQRAKISSALLQARELLQRRATSDEIATALPGIVMAGDTIELDVRLWTLTPDVVDRIAALGFTVRGVHYDSARLTLAGSAELLEPLAALPEVSTIHPRYAPHRRVGAAADQADVSIGAAAARAAFGVDGASARVGILSDSFAAHIGGQLSGSGCERTLTGSAPQVSGDLPAAVTVLEPANDGTDEGAAMAELVHDLAPGADILFRSAVVDEADFADGIDALRQCGATVLVDDTIFLSEPMFQDGVVAAAAERAIAAGIPYFSSAGNEATFGVLTTFDDPDPASEELDTPTGVDFHAFGGGSRFASVTIPAGCGIDVVLQWNEPFSGTEGPGASTDLDLYLYDRPNASGQILASSIDSQGCSMPSPGAGGDPLEIATYINTGQQARTVYVAVDNFCGAASPTFRLVTFPERCGFSNAYAFDTAIFHDAQIYGHPAAAGVVAVAAVDYRELDSNGAAHGDAATIDPEAFTSLGGDLPFFFDAAGQALPGGVEFRLKPELTAPDGTNTTFFGGDRGDDADTFPNFFGTSAAAPHAAAAAALMRQADPGLSPADMRRILMDTARDIGAPGVDARTGAGSVDAMAALAAVRTAASPTATVTPAGTPARLPGDCDGDGTVVIAELVRGLRIALDGADVSDCPALDQNGDGHVSVDELILAIDAALGVVRSS